MNLNDMSTYVQQTTSWMDKIGVAIIAVVVGLLIAKIFVKMVKTLVTVAIILSIIVFALALDYPRWFISALDRPDMLIYFDVDVYATTADRTEMYWTLDGHKIGENGLQDLNPSRFNDYRLAIYLDEMDLQDYTASVAAVNNTTSEPTIGGLFGSVIDEWIYDFKKKYIAPWSADSKFMEKGMHK